MARLPLEIKNNSIRSEDIENNRVSSGDVKNRSLLALSAAPGGGQAGARRADGEATRHLHPNGEG